MDISSGFQIEQPNIFIPWGISEAELVKLLRESNLRRVTDGYFVIQCSSLGGLSHELGFHFDARVGGHLVELEFFESSYSYGQSSFEAFQKHLEATFGQPTSTMPGTEGFPSHAWRLHNVEVLHYVQERFGPAEYVRIKQML
jgi:hypothetical protein